HLREKIVDHGVTTQSFHDVPDSPEVSRPGAIHSLLEVPGNLGETSMKADSIPKGLDNAKNPGLAEKSLGFFPGWIGLAKQVQQEETLFRNGSQQGPILRRFPEPRIIDK